MNKNTTYNFTMFIPSIKSNLRAPCTPIIYKSEGSRESHLGLFSNILLTPSYLLYQQHIWQIPLE